MMFQSFNSCGSLTFNHRIYDNYNFCTHLHKNTEFLYVADGSIDITVNNKKERAVKGQYALIPPFHLHSFETQYSSRVWVGVFSNDFIGGFISMMNKKTAKNFVFNLENDMSEKLFGIHELNILQIKSLLYLLCGEFAERCELCENDMLSNNLLSRIMTYISENVTDNLTLQSLSDYLGYEKHYISRLFNNSTDMNFRYFINMCRIEIAKELLRTTDKSVTETAFCCGYANLRTFNRAFRSFMQCTPNQYRKCSVEINLREELKA